MANPSSADSHSSAAGTRPRTTSGSELPPEVRAFAAILTLDLLLGVWLALNDAGALTTFVAPQVPILGLGGLAWGFLPEEPKKAFGVWLSRILATRGVFWLVLLVSALGLGASLFVSTVIVQSVDPGVSTTLHVVRGTWENAGPAALNASHELRLNRLTTPQRKHLFISPFGERVWVYTPTRVSVLSPKILPWFPARLQYPDDFESMVTVEVLPDDRTLAKLSHHDLLLSMTDGSAEVIEAVVLHEGSVRIAFTEPEAIGSSTIERWREVATEMAEDEVFVDSMLEAWAQTKWVPARYPLRVGQRLHYEIRSNSGEFNVAEELLLGDVVTRLDLSF